MEPGQYQHTRQGATYYTPPSDCPAVVTWCTEDDHVTMNDTKVVCLDYATPGVRTSLLW